MKKKRTLSDGMTLVEVIVAMTIFAVMCLGIMTILTMAIKTANTAKQRDLETAQQENSIKKQKADELASEGKFTLKYKNSSGHEILTKDVELYSAKAKQFGYKFDYSLKTFQESALGFNTPTIVDLTSTKEVQNKLVIQNNTSSDVTVEFIIRSGYVFEGRVSNGYIHTAQSYLRTISGTSNIDFGYSYPVDETADFDIYLVDQSSLAIWGPYNPLNITYDAVTHTYTLVYDG